MLLATALAQFTASPLIGFDDSLADAPIVPPGPFFAAWAPVLVGCVAAAAWGLPTRRARTTPYATVHAPLTISQVGYVAWLLAYASPAPWLTVPVFVVMIVALGVGLRRVLAAPADPVTRFLLGGTLGVYAGWSTAAVWVNAATLLPDPVLDGSAANVVEAALVAGAAATAWVGVHLPAGQIAYTFTAAWALTGVALSAARAVLPLTATTAVAGLVAVTTVTVLSRRRRPVGIRPRRAGLPMP